MQVLKIANNARTLPVLLHAGIPLTITSVLWATSLYEVSLPQVIAAFILCWIPWAAYGEWVKGTREKFPLFALIGVVYWLAYAVPLFWLKHDISLVTGKHQLSENAITQSLYLVIFGVAALGSGMAGAGGLRFIGSFRLDIHRVGTMALLEIFAASSSIAQNCSTNQYAGRGRPSVPSHYRDGCSVGRVCDSLALLPTRHGDSSGQDPIGGLRRHSPGRGNLFRLAGKFRWRGNHGCGGLCIRKTKTPARCDHDRCSHYSFSAARQREISSALLASRCFGELCRAIQFLDG